MKIGILRTEDGHDGERSVYVVDPTTTRGLVLYGHGLWDLVKVHDLPSIQGAEQIENYLIEKHFLPITIPDAEFNQLYTKAKSNKSPLFRAMKDFEPSEAPTLKELVEENREAFIRRVAHIVDL